MRGFWAIAAVGLLVGGCGEEAAEAPELRHCRAALGWMVKGIGSATVIDRRAWDQEGGRSVTLVYELDTGQGGTGGPSRHFIQCRYPGAAGEGRRRIWADTIVMDGTPLSVRQIRTINVTISMVGERKAD